MRSYSRHLVLTTLLTIVAVVPAVAGTLTAEPLELPAGASWTVLQAPGHAWSPFPAGFEGRMFWDLRPAAGLARTVRWAVVEPSAEGLATRAAAVQADAALCAYDVTVGGRIGCGLYRSEQRSVGGPRFVWSELDDPAGSRAAAEASGLRAGLSFAERFVSTENEPVEIYGRATAEGIVLLPAGPREVVLLREEIERGETTSLRYRFLTAKGLAVATLEGPLPVAGEPFVADRGEVLLDAGSDGLDDGIEVSYSDVSQALQPGAVGLMQYSVINLCSVSRTPCSENADCPTTALCGTPLTDVDAGWTSVQAMIDVDQPSATYQPDPGDPGSSQNLGEIWDFTTIDPTVLNYRTFNATRGDLSGARCPENCASRDQSAAPPDGTWQSYLKIDTYDPGGTVRTHDIFTLNDNDTGADPSIDLPYVVYDELNVNDWTQICTQDSAGGADRFVRFFQFFGADPASAVLKLNDTWRSGAWTECDDDNGLRLTLASACDELCYPDCNGTDPRARGMFPGGAGFDALIIDDGWIRVPAGNYVPALLMRQITDVEAGLDFLFAICSLGTERLYSIDYFWVHERYGLLASVSSPTDATATMPPDDWSLLNNVTDGTDITWGPYPPYQVEASACLSGTHVSWALPEDGSNLSGGPGISDWGYVVSWGSQTDPELLADWTGNPNHSPLPGAAGYLSASPGNETTSFVIDGWLDPAINVTVTTALNYTDPTVLDTTAFRSAAFFKVVEDPARLDAGAFVVGDGVVPFSEKNGSDIDLSWPAVAGAASYLVRVYDLDARVEIPCPAAMDCTPTAPATTHPGAAADGANYGYRASAVDACGEESAN